MADRLVDRRRSSVASAASPLSRGSGLPRGVSTGPLRRRLVAQLVDVAVPVLLVYLAGLVAGRAADRTVTVLSLLLVVAWSLLVWAMFATRAAGPGMRLMHLQLVGLQDGRPIGWGRFLGRQLVLALLTVSVVGLLAMLVVLARQPRRQGWHDLAAASVVIRERPLAPRARPAAEPAPAGPAPEESSPAEPLPAARQPAAGGPELDDLPTPLSPSSPAGPTPGDADPGTATRERVDASAESAGPATGSEPSGWFAVLDDGREVDVTALVLLGRNPQVRPGEEQADLVKVGDTTRTVSKTHLSLGAVDDAIWVTDRGSTNGTTATTPDGVSAACPAGEPVAAAEDVIVSFGDRWLRIGRRPPR